MDLEKLTDKLYELATELEKAESDQILLGTGYLEVTSEGIKHIPADKLIRIRDKSPKESLKEKLVSTAGSEEEYNKWAKEAKKLNKPNPWVYPNTFYNLDYQKEFNKYAEEIKKQCIFPIQTGTQVSITSASTSSNNFYVPNWFYLDNTATVEKRKDFKNEIKILKEQVETFNGCGEYYLMTNTLKIKMMKNSPNLDFFNKQQVELAYAKTNPFHLSDEELEEFIKELNESMANLPAEGRNSVNKAMKEGTVENCNHSWKHYDSGFLEKYDFCEHCDEKRK